MSNPVTALVSLAVDELSDQALAAANSAVVLYGVISPGNPAFQDLLDYHIIDEGGRPCDLQILKNVLSAEVDRRF